MKTTNSKCREFVQAQRTFIANNLHADNRGGLYIVYSYGWYPLFIHNSKTGEWLENSERYSVSTSKQKSQSHPLCETKKMTHQEIADYIQFELIKELVA